jgi:hypothetical protein
MRTRCIAGVLPETGHARTSFSWIVAVARRCVDDHDASVRLLITHLELARTLTGDDVSPGDREWTGTSAVRSRFGSVRE